MNVPHSVNESEIKAEILNNNATDVIGITSIMSRKIRQPTKLIRAITNSNNQVSADQIHCFKRTGSCVAAKQAGTSSRDAIFEVPTQFGHPANGCIVTRCLRRTQEHFVKVCTVQKETAKSTNCRGVQATVYRGCQAHQTKTAEVSTKQTILFCHQQV